jgi:hypothetical protein
MRLYLLQIAFDSAQADTNEAVKTASSKRIIITIGLLPKKIGRLSYVFHDLQ